MAFLDHVLRCNRHDLTAYRSFVFAGADLGQAVQRVGWVREDRLPLLRACGASTAAGAHVSVEQDRIVLRGDDEPARTAALTALVECLGSQGHLRMTGELYAVRRRIGGPRLALLDRGAVAWFGVAATGVHVNGFVRTPAGVEMWIAHRARGKATFPGMLDNMVAGGQPDALSWTDNVVKECGEEAGIPPALAASAKAVGAVSYVFENESGLKPDTMFCYDLELPADFVPGPVDGEVDRFERLPLDAVAALVRDTERFKFNCNLVVLDFLVRHGWLAPEDPDYMQLVAGLHRSLPDLEGVP